MAKLDYKFQSLDGSFPRKLTPSSQRQSSPFGKSWTQILEDLERETRALHARYGSVVIMTGHTPYYVNQNGTLRSGAGQPEHPGVIVKFEAWNATQKKYEVLTFDCDRFTTYQANTQAIAGAMEALRKVDRYGVGNAGRDQYAGFKALPSAEGKVASVDEAAAFLAEHSGYDAAAILTNPSTFAAAWRMAATKLHPDKKGDPIAFAKLVDARKLLEAHCG